MKPWLGPLALLGLASTIVGDLLFSGFRLVASAQQMDLPVQFSLWRQFGFGEMLAGRLALWNPHVFSGVPFFANFESALLYPFNWLHLFLRLSTALNLVIAIHIALAGILMALWCQWRGISCLGSFLAGTTFMFSGPFFLHIYAGHLPVVCAMAWAPAIFWCLDAILTGSRRKAVLCGIGVVALQILSGNPQILYQTCVLAAGYLGFRLWRETRRHRALLDFSAIYLGGLSIAAVQLLPGIDAARESIRSGGLPVSVAASLSLPFGALRSLFLFPPRTGYFWENGLYIGAPALLLAGIGVIRGKTAERAALVTAVVALIFALGSHTFFFPLFYRFLPGFSYFRGNSKFAFLTALFLARLAATGFDAVPRRLGLAAAALSVTLSVVFAFQYRGITNLGTNYPPAWKEILDKSPKDARVLHMEFFPNIAMALGAYDIWGYGSFVLKRYARFMAYSQGRDPDTANQYLGFSRFPKALRVLRCAFAFRPPNSITKLNDPLPKLLLIDRWQLIEDSKAALAAVFRPDLDLGKTVILEKAPIPLPSALGPPGKVQLIGETPNELEIEAHLDKPEILLVTDAYARGWKARAVGPGAPQSRYDVLAADYVVRAIPLASGRHRFRLYYAPDSYFIGKIISLIALLLYAGAWLPALLKR